MTKHPPARYRYVGPDAIREAARHEPEGARIASREALAQWTVLQGTDELRAPVTYVVDLEGCLRLAPRRSEHVACAGGEDVQAAGELVLAHDRGRWRVSEITNQSTGYCPDAGSWPAVAAALDRAGIERPPHFTLEFVFRRCPACRALTVIKDEDYTCAACGGSLAP